MEMKQSQIFFHGIYSNLTTYLFDQKNIKVSPWLSKSKFLSFMTKLNPKNGNEQNQIFFHGAYSNLTLFFIGCKIRKYLNDFYRGSFSTSLQMWVQTIIVKQNHTGNVQICQYFSLFTAQYTIWIFKSNTLFKFISW